MNELHRNTNLSPTPVRASIMQGVEELYRESDLLAEITAMLADKLQVILIDEENIPIQKSPQIIDKIDLSLRGQLVRLREMNHASRIRIDNIISRLELH